MKVNLYKIHSLSSHFSPQPNKLVFNFFTFPPSQPNTNERNYNLFYRLFYSPIFPSVNQTDPKMSLIKPTWGKIKV